MNTSPYPLKAVLLGWIVRVPWQPNGVGAKLFTTQQAANEHGAALWEAFNYGRNTAPKVAQEAK
jgi:hypothetical protein